MLQNDIKSLSVVLLCAAFIHWNVSSVDAFYIDFPFFEYVFVSFHVVKSNDIQILFVVRCALFVGVKYDIHALSFYDGCHQMHN